VLTKYRDIDKFYISPYDKFLTQFDRDHVKSASQLKEIQKNQRIAQLRDAPGATPEDKATVLWDGF